MYWEKINVGHYRKIHYTPPKLFNPSDWIPPTCRNRIDKEGIQYLNIRYNPNTKTFIYDIKLPNKKPNGPYHGRSINWFLQQKELL